MYSGTQYIWHDEAFLGDQNPIAVDNNAPIFMLASAFSKGVEYPIEIENTDFNKMYGTMNFEKYGQISIQAQNTINAGGRLFVKRLVAEDSTLANVVIAVRLSDKQKEQQKYDENGNPLYYTDETKTAETTEVTDYPAMELVYYDDDGNETTEDTGNPVMIAVLKWEAKTVEGASTDFETAYNAVDELVAELNDEDGIYPVFVIKDNGRGTSAKGFRVTPDYTISRGADFMFYRANIYDNNSLVEEKVFTLDPDVIYADNAYRLEDYSCSNVIARVDEYAYRSFLSDLADITMTDTSVLRRYDLINGVTNRGTVISNITIDDESVDLNASTGIALQNGTNGVFGDAPMQSDEGQQALYKAMCDYYNGEMTNEIYDVDQHLVCCILDAAFPNEVKDAIGNLVAFRKDCVFLRDIGIGHYTYGDVFAALSNLPEIPEENSEYATIRNDASSISNAKFFSDYITSYQVRDPLTKKRIEVTLMYDLATVLVDHFESAPNAPLAGQINGFILQNAIKGTVNFVPLNTPKVNQKQAIDDLHANYASFDGDLCVVQSLYTCQEKKSQLIYMNNVVAIQYVMRQVRKACPRNRFSLADGRDLTNYATAVDRVLEDYKNMFSVLEFEYVQNDLESDNKIFSATIRFAFNNWAQTERFDLFAINQPSTNIE